MSLIPHFSVIGWIIIGVMVLIFFGNKKLKEFGQGLGESGKELKRAKKELRSALDNTPLEPEKNEQRMATAKPKKKT